MGQFIEVELVRELVHVRRDQPARVGVRLKPEPGWHVYWKYAGDSGAAPKFSWTVHGTPTSAEIAWPQPKRIAFGPLVNYGYDSEVLLPVTVAIPQGSVNAHSLTVEVDAEWLVCLEECIPGNAKLSTLVPIRDAEPERDARWGPLFDQTRARVPARDGTFEVSAWQEGAFYVLKFPRPQKLGNGPVNVTYFPASPGQIENAAPQSVQITNSHVLLQLTKSVRDPTPVRELSGIISAEVPIDARGLHNAIEIDIAVHANQSPHSAGSSSRALHMTVWQAVLFAFLGGLILNLMPCVFPVISIKILSLLELAGNDYRKVRVYGLSFSAGIIVSFLSLALIIFALQRGGATLGWGFQLQSPQFVSVMAILIFGIALNMMGIFDVGASLQRIGGSIKQGKGIMGTFLSGVLATALASPCTAPFMGSAVAFALTLPLASALLVFTALGAGMAIPYILLTFWPRWLKYLPHPGAWMDTIKQLLAFPLFATVVWLAWILGQQSGTAGMVILLWSLLITMFALWLVGRFGAPMQARSVRFAARLSAALLIAVSLYLSTQFTASAKEAHPESNSSILVDQWGQRWEAFSKQAFAAAVESGDPLFVDFTAAWCITCQYNKQVVFSSSEVRDEIIRRKVRLMRADWTNEDEDIGEVLQQFGRRGVPLNLLYRGDGAEPEVFPAILTASLVLESLRKIQK